MMYYRKNIVFGVCSGLLIGCLIVFECFFVGIDTENKNRVSFSKESGFYEKDFLLELSTVEGGVIYYTLDGSIPDKNSTKYEAPILINDASVNENIYSMRTDVSAGFYSEEVEKISMEGNPEYRIPEYKIDKATVIQAVAYDKSGIRSEVAVATYYVGFQEKSGYEGMNVLSLITTPENLFDYETGIYVTGKEYDQYVKNYRNTGEWYWREEYWSLWSANYRNRGIKWEREAWCQFFDQNGELELSQKCGIRIHGGMSRGYNPKSLNIYARKEYDGNKNFELDFWNTGYYPDVMTLFQGGNDYRTKAKDYLVANEIKGLQISSMNFQPYVLFLNGEYWGIYWLNEKYDADYLEYYYEVSSDNVILIKNGVLAEGTEDDKKYYYDMLNFSSNSDMTNSKNYDKVCSLIDIESYVDYYAVMIYLGRNGDWPSSNYALWRVKKTESGFYGDGKWRWMIFDLNSSGFESSFDSIGYVMENDDMFQNMMNNDSFRKKFFARLEEVSALFQYEKMSQRIAEYKQFMTENMKIHEKRFYGDDSGIVFEKRLKEIESFFLERNDYIQKMIEEYR